jgi:hypothetical protein
MPRQNSKSEEAGNDLVRSGRVNTEVSTRTVVEDRTAEPNERPRMEYQSTERDHGNGTIETIYGEPVGGFLKSDDA